MVLVVILDMQGDTGFVLSVAFSPDGRTLASGNMGKIMNLKLWDVASGRILRFLQGHTDDVHSVVFSPDGSSFVSGSDDKSIKFWNVASGELLHNFDHQLPIGSRRDCRLELAGL
jgi:WD40 repeat protein